VEKIKCKLQTSKKGEQKTRPKPKELTIQRLSAEVVGKAQKYTRIGAENSGVARPSFFGGGEANAEFKGVRPFRGVRGMHPRENFEIWSP
jgi:hypothetical protein